MSDLFAERGTDCNKVKIGGVTELLGDPKIKIEQPHTIIRFPGGSVEIARTSDDNYWVHVAVRDGVTSGGDPEGAAKIIRARMDHDGRYNDEGNSALNDAVAAGDVNHIAFLVQPPRRQG